MPTTAAGGSAANEEPQVASDDDVEEVQSHPRDGRQHVYVWRQRGDRFIGHEELAETEEAARVERAAKRLVDEVKVGGPVYCFDNYVQCSCVRHMCFLAGRDENGEVLETVLRSNRGHCSREQGLVHGGGPAAIRSW